MLYIKPPKGRERLAQSLQCPSLLAEYNGSVFKTNGQTHRHNDYRNPCCTCVEGLIHYKCITKGEGQTDRHASKEREF